MKTGFFLALVLAASTVGRVQDSSRKDDSGSEVSFEINQSFGLILVRGQVNGQPATLVVDTGASHTILSSELLRVRPSQANRANVPAKGSGYVGSGEWVKATLEVGTMVWHDRRVLMMDDFQDLSNSMKQRVDGILGQDILKEFDSVVIDFRHHRLALLRRGLDCPGA